MKTKMMIQTGIAITLTALSVAAFADNFDPSLPNGPSDQAKMAYTDLVWIQSKMGGDASTDLILSFLRRIQADVKVLGEDAFIEANNNDEEAIARMDRDHLEGTIARNLVDAATRSDLSDEAVNRLTTASDFIAGSVICGVQNPSCQPQN